MVTATPSPSHSSLNGHTPPIHGTEGSALLRAHLTKERITIAAFARLLGVGSQSVHRWLEGTTPPRNLSARAIENLTGIPANSWRRTSEGSEADSASSQKHFAAEIEMLRDAVSTMREEAVALRGEVSGLRVALSPLSEIHAHVEFLRRELTGGE